MEFVLSILRAMIPRAMITVYRRNSSNETPFPFLNLCNLRALLFFEKFEI